MPVVVPDAVSQYGGCRRVFPTDRLACEEYLTADHDRLRDTAVTVLAVTQSLVGLLCRNNGLVCLHGGDYLLLVSLARCEPGLSVSLSVFCHSAPIMRRETSRRAYLRGIGATIGLTGVTTGTESSGPQSSLVNSTQQSQGANHPVVGVNPGRTGHNTEAVGPKQGVNIAWSVGGASNDTPDFRTPPILADGTVYVSKSSSTLGYDAHTGEQIWSTPPQAPIDDEVSPSVVDGVLFQGESGVAGNRPEGTINSINIPNKKLEWKNTEPAIIDSTGYYSPVVANNTVYISTDSTLYSISSNSGSTVWQLDAGNPIPNYFESHISVHNNTAFVGAGDRFGDSELYAIGGDRGITQWNFEISQGGAVSGWPAVTDGIGCISADNLLAFDPADGTLLWQSSEVPNYPPAIADGQVFVGVNGSDSFIGIKSYSTANGVEEWSFKTGSELDDRINAQPVVADGVVYATPGNKLCAFDSETGGKLWEQAFRTPVNGQPVISDGWAYVVTEAGELFGLRGEATGPPPVGPHQADPTDPDSDGQYEDVDGDGDVDIADVQTLYNARDSNTVQSNTSAFDFNNSGDIGIGDVQALFREYLSR